MGSDEFMNDEIYTDTYSLDKGSDDDRRGIGSLADGLCFLDTIFLAGRRWKVDCIPSAGASNNDPVEGISALGRSTKDTKFGLELGDKELDPKNGVDGDDGKPSGKFKRPSKKLRGESNSYSSELRTFHMSWNNCS